MRHEAAHLDLPRVMVLCAGVILGVGVVLALPPTPVLTLHLLLGERGRVEDAASPAAPTPLQGSLSPSLTHWLWLEPLRMKQSWARGE